jgi:hypothetical protein
VSYTLLLEQVRERALHERMVAAHAGATELPDPDKAREEFDTRLERPLNTERLRTAWLREVRR